MDQKGFGMTNDASTPVVQAKGLVKRYGHVTAIDHSDFELRQGETTSRDTDVGFVPLLHLAADWEFAPRWRLLFDFDGLAGGPGRAAGARKAAGGPRRRDAGRCGWCPRLRPSGNARRRNWSG